MKQSRALTLPGGLTREASDPPAGNPVLDRLRAERQSQTELMDGILAAVESESRDLVDAEVRNLEAIRERIGQIDAQIEPLDAFEALRSANRQATQHYRPTAPAGGGQGGGGM